MKLVKLLLISVCVATLVGCAQVPPQSVELSTTLGRDLQQLQRSHRKAIDLLHDWDVERINRYVEQVVIPTYVKTVIEGIGPRMSQDLAKAIGPNGTQSDKDRVYDEMRKVVLGISSRTEKQKQELLGPVEDARRARLQELDMAYAQLQQANSVLTAHLASVAKVNAVQDELLAKTGLVEFRRKVGDSALAIDKLVEDALSKATDAEDANAKLKAIFEQVSKTN